MNLVQLGMIGAGGVLIYGAVKDVNPLEVAKNSLTGKPLPISQSAGSGSTNSGNTGQTIPGTKIPVNKSPGANAKHIGEGAAKDALSGATGNPVLGTIIGGIGNVIIDGAGKLIHIIKW